MSYYYLINWMEWIPPLGQWRLTTSLRKAIEHGKEHRNIRHYHDCRCERCRMNLLYSSVHRAHVDDNGNIIGDRSIINAIKAFKNGVTKHYRG